MGLGYRWNLDIASLLSLTPWHSQTFFQMVGVGVELLDYSSEGVAYALLDRMFNRFGV